MTPSTPPERVKCPNCGNRVRWTHESPCPTCNGTGSLPTPPAERVERREHFLDTPVTLWRCPVCGAFDLEVRFDAEGAVPLCYASDPPRDMEPYTYALSNPADELVERAKFALACLSGDHRKAGELCGEAECWLCAAQTTLEAALQSEQGIEHG